jgi:outer membrane immunogenic protein
MRKLAVTLTLGTALCLSVPAFAADVVEEQPYDWSGVYAGIFAGVGQTSSDWDGTDNEVTGPVNNFEIDESLDETSFFLGGLLGVNFQHDEWVFGVEGDIGWFHSKERESLDLDGTEGLDLTSKIDLLGSVRARAGYAMDRTLVYVTGGLAFADTKHTWDDGGLSPTSLWNGAPESVDLDFGWVAGAGIEHAWTDNWLVRLEGLYYDLGSEDGEVLAGDAGAPETDSFKVDQEIWIARIGLSYKFN